ncbi:DUF2071 domain-containing protein [Aestuariivivens insulae]|uniref:DUF2071 domain-containing protein n=1 Tax=Aestuariivivens insulae TaxID=1621988 RepID=UPI001F5AB7A7|nr:DUF2071 domain-containing protein [Aestuariivivens insulae]
MKPKNIFMTCEWKNLIMSTYEVDKSILEPYLPPNTELDLYQDKALISLVAFTFSKVKFFGFKIPFHQHFGQINFRFYAKSKIDGSKGVVFIREFAPKLLIALVGNKIYNEPYYFKRIRYKKHKTQDNISLKYSYQKASVQTNATLKTKEPLSNTLTHFIVDRYIAFVKSKKKTTLKYNIYHRPWKTYQPQNAHVDHNLLKLLPTNFKNLKHLSTYLIDGSEVSIQKGMLQ